MKENFNKVFFMGKVFALMLMETDMKVSIKTMKNMGKVLHVNLQESARSSVEGGDSMIPGRALECAMQEVKTASISLMKKRTMCMR